MQTHRHSGTTATIHTKYIPSTSEDLQLWKSTLAQQRGRTGWVSCQACRGMPPSLRPCIRTAQTGLYASERVTLYCQNGGGKLCVVLNTNTFKLPSFQKVMNTKRTRTSNGRMCNVFKHKGRRSGRLGYLPIPTTLFARKKRKTA